jgi:hypothetical protein
MGWFDLVYRGRLVWELRVLLGAAMSQEPYTFNSFLLGSVISEKHSLRIFYILGAAFP